MLALSDLSYFVGFLFYCLFSKYNTVDLHRKTTKDAFLFPIHLLLFATANKYRWNAIYLKHSFFMYGHLLVQDIQTYYFLRQSPHWIRKHNIKLTYLRLLVLTSLKCEIVLLHVSTHCGVLNRFQWGQNNSQVIYICTEYRNTHWIIWTHNCIIASMFP